MSLSCSSKCLKLIAVAGFTNLLFLGQIQAFTPPSLYMSKVWEQGEWETYQDLDPILVERKTWSYRGNAARYDLRATNNSPRVLCMLVEVDIVENGRADQVAKKSLLLPNHKTDLGWVGASDPSREWDIDLNVSSTREISRCFDQE